MSGNGQTLEGSVTRGRFKLPFHQELQSVYTSRMQAKKEDGSSPVLPQSSQGGGAAAVGAAGSTTITTASVAAAAAASATLLPLQPADAQKVQRSFNAFAKDAKALFSLVNKTISLVKDTEACYLQLCKRLRGMYESGESVLSPYVERLYALMDDDDLNGMGQMEDFELEWNAAEEWFRSAHKTLKGAKPEELAYFMEQRFDGLDKAVLSFVMLAQKGLGPKASAKRAQLNSALDETMQLESLCPTMRDAGVSATTGGSAEAVLGQLVPAHYLRMYLATLLTEENVDFCLAVHVLESMHSQDPRGLATRAKAREIIETYVSDASENQINISDTLKKKVIEAARADPVAIAPFKDAYAEIIRLMHTANSPVLFKQTPFYAKLVRRLTPRPYSPPFSLEDAKAMFYAALTKPPQQAAPQPSQQQQQQQQQLKRQKSSPLVPPLPSLPTASTTFSGPLSGRRQPSSSSKTQLSVGLSPRKGGGESVSSRARKKRETLRMTLRQQSSHSFVTLKKKDIPNGRYITMEDVLKNRPLYKDFKHFLQEKGGEKPLRFVSEVGAFARKKFPSQLEIRAEATQIFEKYLIFSDVEPSIGTSFESQQDLYAKIYESPDKPLKNDMFAKASREVTEVMKLTVFIQYLISERWLTIKWTPCEEQKFKRSSPSSSSSSSSSSTTASSGNGFSSSSPSSSHKSHHSNSATSLPRMHDSTSLPQQQQYQQSLPQQQRQALYHSKSHSEVGAPMISQQRLLKPVVESSKLSTSYSSSSSSSSLKKIKHQEPPKELPPPPPPPSEAAPVPIEESSPHLRSSSSKLAEEVILDSDIPVPNTPAPAPPPPAAPPEDTRAELLENYKTTFLPKYETLVKALGGLKVFDDLVAQRNNVRIIQTISQCVDGISLPQGVVAPQFTVINENPKFVHFRKKLLKCTWETSQKISFIIRDLAASKEYTPAFTTKIADYTDIYHNLLLAFSTTQ